MERLKGKEILIGREPLKHCLLIGVKSGSQIKSSIIDKERSLPNSISRCILNEGKAHCKISVGQDGMMVIHNLKAQNVTYVNDMEVESRELTNKCKV